MEDNKLKGACSTNKWKFFSNIGGKVEISDAIFPVIKQEKDGSFHLIGTGFFVSNHGIFITAKHVLQEVCNSSGIPQKAIGGIHFIEKDKYIIRPVLQAWSSDRTDLSIGMLAHAYHNGTGKVLENQKLALTLSKPKIGDEIVTYAFPDFSRSQINNKQTLRFKPKFFDGQIQEYFPERRDSVMLPFPCYRTTIHIHGGASGGPVVGKNGKVFGINCLSMDPETDLSFVVPIDEIISKGFFDNVNFDKNEPGKRIYIKEFIDKGLIYVE